MAKEAKARIKINKMLEEAGWRFFDTKDGRANIILENNTKLTQTELNNLGKILRKQKMDLSIIYYWTIKVFHSLF